MAKAKKLPSGSWRVRVFSHMEGEKKVYRSFTAPSKKEAELKASLFAANKDLPSYPFKVAAERYIETKASVLSPNTVRTYKTLLDRLTPIHSILIDRISNEVAQMLIDSLTKKYVPKTVRSTYGLVTAVLLFYSIPLPKVSLPEIRPAETKIPSQEEVKRMIAEAPSEDLKIAIQLAAFGSLRSGEACALSRRDLHGDHISVARTFVLSPDQEWIIKDSPKTVAGYRDIPLPTRLMASLSASNREDGRIIKYTPASLHDAFRRLTRRLRIYPYKFHSLRHYFASMMHERGVPDKVIAKIGGWEDLSTLQRIYQHATQEGLTQAGKVINDLWSEST